MQHSERHRSASIGWLRAAVLGADDGILSTASLVVGVAAAGSSRHQIMLAGAAGLVAGALSMAAGEYVSVSSQADTEKADLVVERTELATQRSAEERELASIYVQRGLDPELARTVAVQLMAHDALLLTLATNLVSRNSRLRVLSKRHWRRQQASLWEEFYRCSWSSWRL